MVLGKKVAIFDWEWGPIQPLEMGRKSPADNLSKLLTFQGQSHHLFPSLLAVG